MCGGWSGVREMHGVLWKQKGTELSYPNLEGSLPNQLLKGNGENPAILK